MWILTAGLMSVNMNRVERVQKSREEGKFFARAYFDHRRYVTLKDFDKESECDEYIKGLAEAFFDKDFPADKTTRLFKDRWFGKEKNDA